MLRVLSIFLFMTIFGCDESKNNRDQNPASPASGAAQSDQNDAETVDHDGWFYDGTSCTQKLGPVDKDALCKLAFPRCTPFKTEQGCKNVVKLVTAAGACPAQDEFALFVKNEINAKTASCANDSECELLRYDYGCPVTLVIGTTISAQTKERFKELATKVQQECKIPKAGEIACPTIGYPTKAICKANVCVGRYK